MLFSVDHAKIGYKGTVDLRREEMNRKLLIGLLIISIIATLVGCTSNEKTDDKTTDKPLVVAMELAYPPFETKDEAGNPMGISVDLAKAFGEHIGREVVIENTAWDGLIPSLQTGKADMVISSMTITAERDKVVDFSVPYANTMLAILTNKDAGVEKAEDLNQSGKVIAVKTGSTGHSYAQANLTNAEILALADESACVTEVAQGKADGFIYDQLTIYRNWKNNEDTTAAVFIPFQDADRWGAAVAEGNSELKAQFDDFIAKFKEEGGFDKLTEKHLAEEKKAFDDFGFKWFFDLD